MLLLLPRQHRLILIYQHNALSAGKHVLVEKPICDTIEKAEEYGKKS